ncbi:MAG TPA: hypothetical protein VG694_01565 [Candidatus Paceibacterota bacterium]|nr:hypothetical protein [Candidatus Paceibacterota bacterium]
MRIYISHSSDFSLGDTFYRPLKDSRLNTEHDFFLPHENEINPETEDKLRNSDLVLAEVSKESTRQGIELGLASSLGIPIVCAYKTGADSPRSLGSISKYFIEYSGAEDLAKQFTDFLGSNH